MRKDLSFYCRQLTNVITDLNKSLLQLVTTATLGNIYLQEVTKRHMLHTLQEHQMYSLKGWNWNENITLNTGCLAWSPPRLAAPSCCRASADERWNTLACRHIPHRHARPRWSQVVAYAARENAPISKERQELW